METGFITNKQEEEYLNSETGQQETAECISRALGTYMDWLSKQPKATTGTVTSPRQDANAALAMLESIEREEQARQKGN